MAGWPNAGSAPNEGVPMNALLIDAQNLYRTAKNRDLLRLLESAPVQADKEVSVKLLTLHGMALFDLGDVTGSLPHLTAAVDEARNLSPSIQLGAVFARFLRLSDFLAPDDIIPHLAQLRQLASSTGDGPSLAALHLAVARVEGCRGRCSAAHHHLELARRFINPAKDLALACTVDIVEASLEIVAGNLSRSRKLAEACLSRADPAGFVKYQLAGYTNLATIAIYRGQFQKARALLDAVIPNSDAVTYVRLGALDAMAVLELREGNRARSEQLIGACLESSKKDILPARSWYDLAHQLTRCTYFEQIEDWSAMIAIADEADDELARRQYKAVRTSLLCAKARALARKGRQAEAGATLAAAVRACPRGAVDPLIVLEATKALCAALKGDATSGSVHYDRAIAACRSIGHRYHEWWIDKQRADVQARVHAVTQAATSSDITQTSLLVSDVATILGAGHSIDLLAHRVAAILQSTPMASRVEIVNESGHDYRPEPTAEWEAAADGTFTIRLAGSDRFASITVRGATSIEEISLLKGMTDLVQIAVARTAESDREDEDLTLWPRTEALDGDDTIFRSPRMMELLRIAERLAATNIPVLITGETGTGKEVIARFIHDRSTQKRGPFVPFNCSAVARDLVESQLFGHRRGAFTGAVDAFPGVIKAAERGTLFLDEIGDLESLVQPKLLRFLESGEIHPVGEARPHRVGVRIVAATNSNLETLADEGRFRRDLLFRIGVARLELPPLRERKDEIPAFAALFLARYARECGRANLRFGDDAIAALLLYNWPGNIRQLANEIRRVAALASDGQTLTAADLSPDISATWNARPQVTPRPASPTVEVRLDQPLAVAIADLERKFIEHALSTSHGRVTDAAERLGLSRKGLFLKRRRAGLT